MSVNLVQDDVKHQGKYVLCRDMHFGHITAGNYRRRFLSNSNWKNLQLKLAPGSKLVQKWVNKFPNLGTVEESKSPGEVDHQTTGHHQAGCRLRPAEPEKVHDLASGTGASAERLSKDHEGRLHRFYLHMNKYFFFMILRRVVLLTPDMPDAKWTFPGSAGRRRQLARWWWSGGLTYPGDLHLSTVPKLRNLLTHFCTSLLPGASLVADFSNWSSTGIAAYSFLQ